MNTHYNNQDIVSKLRSKIFIFKAKPDILQRNFYLKGLSDWAFAIIWEWDFPEEWLQMYWVRQNMINTR